MQRSRSASTKAAENLKKHGVAFNEAVTVFADPLASIFDDFDHSGEEPRELIIGHSVNHRVILVSFTEAQSADQDHQCEAGDGPRATSI